MKEEKTFLHAWRSRFFSIVTPKCIYQGSTVFKKPLDSRLKISGMTKKNTSPSTLFYFPSLFRGEPHYILSLTLLGRLSIFFPSPSTPFSVIASMAYFAMRGDLSSSLLSPLNASIRGPQYLKNLWIPDWRFREWRRKTPLLRLFFLSLTLPGRTTLHSFPLPWRERVRVRVSFP